METDTLNMKLYESITRNHTKNLHLGNTGFDLRNTSYTNMLVICTLNFIFRYLF